MTEKPAPMRPEDVPQELVETAAEAICEASRHPRRPHGGHFPTWDELNDPRWGAGRMRADEFRDQARAALAAVAIRARNTP